MINLIPSLTYSFIVGVGFNLWLIETSNLAKFYHNRFPTFIPWRPKTYGLEPFGRVVNVDIHNRRSIIEEEGHTKEF